MQAAQDLMKRYLATTAVQARIDRAIQDDSAYAWAKNPVQRQKFAETASTPEAALNSNYFHRFFVTNDMANVRAKFAKECEPNLVRFHDDLKDAVCALEKQQARFNKMHLANCEG